MPVSLDLLNNCRKTHWNFVVQWKAMNNDSILEVWRSALGQE